ncbi:hypothetical protein [Guptibacillus algicola]|uniref:hypothetical protein n=1 Tax=Guptibacillus algicola TaxID=225844 RepID=UPI001CD2C200|nr:hypothetical protein [Alkalihalobacillus algicola]MCA0988209.1 hypothetical protein [Alkalihalobacillus algicola]
MSLQIVNSSGKLLYEMVKVSPDLLNKALRLSNNIGEGVVISSIPFDKILGISWHLLQNNSSTPFQ